ncbi:MAG: nitroreductase family protein [Candidatus Omnitrophica bacterium]|nr:nitroreductase family protein [Candidatus Omnitrophota bacterium]
MSVYDIVLRRRSIRCFKKKKVPFSILKKLVNAARLAPSGANIQPCEFIAVNDQATVNKIFPALKWAGYIRPQGDPPKGREPRAYIVVLINRDKRPLCPEADAAACVENILLVAWGYGIASCWLGAIDKNRLGRVLRCPAHCEVKYVVALGYPDERPQVETARGSIKYYKDKKSTLRVPKRSLKEILHRNIYR